ncbi:hypothetical protein LTR60_000281 [Cryomyces antarcticus]|nr:hypothetical protein LTR39_000358 [Cryomyces antarcticus]KAK5020716.1 hypothetical protein LTR60_000281 [Cryomyces antarcticus]
MDDYDLFADLVPEQAYTPHDNPSVLEAPTSGTLPIVPQLASTQNYIPQLFNLSLTSYSDQPHNAQPLSDSQRVPATTMGPPTKPRKRKAPTLRADAWEPYKARIIELHN